ncbi:MAG TPA: GntR family transcriptional regulator [Anaerolineae bacterium]|nr:GntR family transcriptional regulator [Anaerolineae bacterium]
MIKAPILRATTLRGEAFRAIRKEILSGQLAPGTKIVETDLAMRLGVSRNPVREAIGQLEQQGLVVSIPNRGTFIIQPTPEQAYDMFLLRAYLEHLALRLIFTKSEKDSLAPLAEVVEQMDDLVNSNQEFDGEAWGRLSLLDTEFHTRLVQASGSTALLRAWETASPTDIIFLYDRSQKGNLSSNRSEVEGMVSRHRQLLRAMQSGNPREAETELRHHFMTGSRGSSVSLDEASMTLLGWDNSVDGWSDGKV